MATGDMILGNADQVDHPLVTNAGGRSEAEHAVLEQDQSLDPGMGVVGGGGRAGEIEPRHDIGTVATRPPYSRLMRSSASAWLARASTA